MKKKILQYDVVLEKESDGGYSAWVPDLLGCTSQGDSLEEAINNIKELIELYLEDADSQQIEEGRSHKGRLFIPLNRLIDSFIKRHLTFKAYTI